MRAGLIVLGIIIITGMWAITSTQIGQTLPLIGRITALPSIEPLTYIVGFLIIMAGLVLGRKAKEKKKQDDEEEEGEEEPEEEPIIEEE